MQCRDCEFRMAGIFQDRCYGVLEGKDIDASDAACELFAPLEREEEDEEEDKE